MMALAFELVLFDLDGTLVDTAPEICDAVNATLRDHGWPEVALADVQRWIGHGTRELLIQAMAAATATPVAVVRADDELHSVAVVFDRHYSSRCGTRSRPYPGARDALVQLRRLGVRLAIVTNKDSRHAQAVLRAHGLASYFDRIVCGDSSPTRKPDPAGVFACLEAFAIAPARALFIGDSSIDADTARNAGVEVWLFRHGYNMGRPVEDARPDRVVDGFRALIDAFLESPPAAIALDALFWDVDGTLAETERDGHRVAFNLAFEAKHLAWRWGESHYGELLNVTGGYERLLHDMAARTDAPTAAGARRTLAHELHALKNAFYADLIKHSGLPLRAGVARLIGECRQRCVRLGIATTTSRANADALLSANFGMRWRELFDVVVCGEDVQRKKPDPEVYLHALRALGVRPQRAVAIEDSPAGVAAACAAGLAVIATPSAYFADAYFDDATAHGPGLHTRDGWCPALPAAARHSVSLDDIAACCALAKATPPPVEQP